MKGSICTEERDSRGYTEMHRAVEDKDWSRIKELLDGNVNLTVLTSAGTGMRQFVLDHLGEAGVRKIERYIRKSLP